MKKILFAVMTVVVMCACSGERDYPSYRGLSMGMPYQALYDTLLQMGYQIDTAHCSIDSAQNAGLLTLTREGLPSFGLSVKFHRDTIDAIQESYIATYNDSTRNLWQTVRDSLEKTLEAWPNAPLLKNDHKLAEFRYNGGKISVLLENTYTPTMSVLYEATVPED